MIKDGYVVLGRVKNSVFLCSPFNEGINPEDSFFTMVTPLTKSQAEKFYEDIKEGNEGVEYTIVKVNDYILEEE